MFRLFRDLYKRPSIDWSAQALDWIRSIVLLRSLYYIARTRTLLDQVVRISDRVEELQDNDHGGGIFGFLESLAISS